MTYNPFTDSHFHPEFNPEFFFVSVHNISDIRKQIYLEENKQKVNEMQRNSLFCQCHTPILHIPCVRYHSLKLFMLLLIVILRQFKHWSSQNFCL